MSIEQVTPLPPASPRSLLPATTCATALAMAMAIAWAPAASAQSAPGAGAEANPAAQAGQASPAPGLEATASDQWDPAQGLDASAFAQLTPGPGSSVIASAQWAPAPGTLVTASAQSAPQPGTEAAAPAAAAPAADSDIKNSADMSSQELAKEISNPVTSIWQLQFQFNNFKLESDPLSPVSNEWVNNLYFQPVMPISLTKKFNLVIRPVFTLYQSVPYPDGTGGTDRKTAFGDTILATVLSPKGTEPWIFGFGPTFIFPTASSDLIGQEKWQIGPAIGGGYITDKFMIAALVQQWWSVSGDDDRANTSQMNVLPLIYRFFPDGWAVGYSGAILADWKAESGEKWTVPLGVSVSKVVMFGKLPVQIQVAGQYMVESPFGGPDWNVQLQITPVIPRLIKRTIFP